MSESGEIPERKNLWSVSLSCCFFYPEQETPLDDDAEEEFMRNLANSQRITPAGLREMEVKVTFMSELRVPKY